MNPTPSPMTGNQPALSKLGDGSTLMSTIYLSVDIEADGPIPGPYSMLSIGAVAVTIDGRILGSFSANLAPLPQASQHLETMKFWEKYPEAWEKATKEPLDPAAAMKDYRKFIDGLPNRPVFMGYPASFDHAFHRWYLIRYTGDDPCGHHALDLKTLGASLLKVPYREACKANFTSRWYNGTSEHYHVALTDAIFQAILGINMLREDYNLPKVPCRELQDFIVDSQSQAHIERNTS